MLVHDGNGISIEGNPACKHLVENHPKRVDVRSVINWRPLRLLRGKVPRCSQNHSDGCHRLLRSPSGNSKIDNLDLALRSEHDILRLDVAMDDSLIVCILKRCAHLCGHLNCISKRQSALARQALSERSTIKKLHHDVQTSIDGSCLEHMDDVGMHQTLAQVTFLLKLVTSVRVSLM